MHFISKKVLCGVLILLAMGCGDEFVFTPGAENILLVIEGNVISGKGVEFELRQSAAAFSENNLNEPITDANARIYVNGVFNGFIPHISGGNYFKELDLKPGDSVELIVRRDNYPLIRSFDKVPDGIKIYSADSTRTIGETFGMRYTFVDPAGENYYLLRIYLQRYRYTEFSGEKPTDSLLVNVPASFTSANKLFFAENNLLKGIPGLHLFTDQYIQNSPFNLEVGISLNQRDNHEFGPVRSIISDFRHISEGHYNSFTGLLLNNSVYGGPFSHANNVEDNVEGGFGLIQYYWNQTDTILIR